MGKAEILTRNPFPPPIEQALEEAFLVHRAWQAKDAAAFIAGIAGRVRGVATNSYRRADEAFFAQLPKLEILSSFSVGTDHIDLEAARRRGIVVTNTPEVLNECVADLAMALILGLMRRIAEGDRYVRAGKWPSGPLPLGVKLGGKRLGIVGLGAIGSLVAERARAFGMQIAYCNRRPRPDAPYPYHANLAALAQASDILLVVVPGSAETMNLIDAAVIEALGPKGMLVNIARGSVVDDEALIAALRDGRLAGAALDVFRNEPRIPEAYLALENVLLSPHQGSATTETRTAMGRLMVENLEAHFAGKPLPSRVV